MITKLRMSGVQHADLRRHLVPPDGREAVAFALCGRRSGRDVHALSVRKLHLVPHDRCIARTRDKVTWLTASLGPLLGEAAARGWSVVKFHSHPNGAAAFSDLDDIADRELFTAFSAWTDSDLPHGSVIMLPGGSFIGRRSTVSRDFLPIDLMSVVGNDLRFWFADEDDGLEPSFALRHQQAFGSYTAALLRRLSVAVVGCSGTGSVVVEQLARLGVGRLVLVDPDRVEEKNLNRILHATMQDAEQGRLKVDVVSAAVKSMGLGTRVDCFPYNLATPEVVKRVAECDILVGCMDGAEGRYLLNRIATFYLLPYFDVGVRLDADGKGGIDQICGTVHYLQPGGSSLLSRGVITMQEVQAEGLRRTNPDAYEEQVRSKYIHGVREDRPAVVSVNMQYASLAIMEMLARLHSYRVDGNASFAQFGYSLTDPRFEPMKPDGVACSMLAKHVGRGDVTPLLDNPYLSEEFDTHETVLRSDLALAPGPVWTTPGVMAH